jgi:hypothetical protein
LWFDGSFAPAGYTIGSGNCGAFVAPGASCSKTVTFTANGAAGPRSSTLYFYTNLTTFTVGASGTVLPGTSPTYSASASSLFFDTTYIGLLSPVRTLTITNTGGGTLTVGSIALSGGARFTISNNNCVAGLGTGQSCTIDVRFVAPPSTVGALESFSDTLTVNHNATGSTDSISLNGTATNRALVPSQTSYSFGSQPSTAVTSITRTFTNLGGSTISGISAVLTNADFNKTTDTCTGNTLAPNTNCSVTISFGPKGSDGYSADLTMTYTGGAGSPYTLPVNGSTFTPTPPMPAASFSSTYENFGDVVEGSPATQTFTFVNTSGAPLSLGSISNSGYAYGYSIDLESSTCDGATLPHVGSCTVVVKFEASNAMYSLGNQYEEFYLTENTTGAFYNYYFYAEANGVSLAQRIEVDEPNDFSAPVGETDVKTITVRNIGATNLLISSATITGTEFSMSDGCSESNIAPNSSCTIIVTYAPTSGVSSSGTVTINSNDPTQGSYVVYLYGFSDSVFVKADFHPGNPGSLTFASQTVGTTSTGQIISFANVTEDECGSESAVAEPPGTPGVRAKEGCYYVTPKLFVSSVTAPTEFAVAHNCPTTNTTGLTPGNCCTVEVSFAPNSPGTKTGNVVIASNASVFFDDSFYGYPETEPLTPKRAVQGKAGGGVNAEIPVTATAVAAGTPSLTVSPMSYTFATTTVGATSAAQTFTVSNSGTAALQLSALGASPAAEYILGGTCTATTMLSVPPAATSSCTITVVFQPSATGARPGSINITSNTGGMAGTLTTLSLSGTGQTVVGAIAPVITSTPPPQFATTGISYGHNYAASGTAPILWGVSSGSLPPGLNLSSQGALLGSPTLAGTYTFSVTATNAGGSSPAQAASILVQNPLVGAVLAAPSSLSFAAQATGTTSPAQTVRILSTGNGPVQIAGITTTGDFGFSSRCASRLLPNESCEVTVTFSPLTAGRLSGTLSVVTATNTGTSVSLSGEGIDTPRAAINVAPSVMGFAEKPVASPPVTQSLSITNTGRASLALRNLAMSGEAFSVSRDGCGGEVAVGRTCLVEISFVPTIVGNNTGTLAITHNGTRDGSDGTTTVMFFGQGTPRLTPIIRVSGALSFPDTVVGRSSAAQFITIGNAGTANLNINGISISGLATGTNATDFSLTGSCPTLVPGAECQLSATFNPSAPVGRKGASVVVASNASNAAAGVVGLVGTALAVPVPGVGLAPNAIGFGTVAIGGSARRTVTLTNTGVVDLLVSSISGSQGFSIIGDCARTIPRGQSCTFEVQFTASGNQAVTGTVTVVSNAPSSPDQLGVGGTSCQTIRGPASSRSYVGSSCDAGTP